MTTLALVLRLAVRNVVRYVRRSVITALTIALGVVMMLLTIGLSEGMYARAVDTAARAGPGHVVLQVEGFDAFEPKTLPDADAARALAEQVPGGRVALHMQSPVYASTARGSLNAVALGLDPAMDRADSLIAEALSAGEWLADTPASVPGALVGRGGARTLGLEPGDTFVLMAQGEHELDSRLMRVRGLFTTGSDELDDHAIVVDNRTLQGLLGVPGAVHRVAILLPDFRDADAVARTLDGRLPGVRALTWAQALPELGSFVALDRAGGTVMFAVLFGIVGLAVLNAVLMSVLERTQEFGVMLAVGTRPGQLFGVVVLEALLLSLTSALLGAALGGLIVSWVGAHGLDLALITGTPSFDAGGVNISGVVYPELPLYRVRDAVAMVVGLTVVGSLYPAVLAARIAPVEAIRHD